MLKKIVSYVFFVLAVPFLIFAVWSFSNSAEIISEAIEAGQITLFGNLYDIVGFYMANTGAYFVYAFLLTGVGLLLGKKEIAVPLSVRTKKESTDDAELDEWFGSNNHKEDEK
jgi:hypothetical protein